MPKLARYKAGYLLGKFVVFSFSSEHCIQRIDSILPWICPVIDHRGRQNMVKTKKWHTHLWLVCPFFLFLSHFDVICYLLLNRRTATWNVKPGWIKVIRAGETVNGFSTGQLEWVLGGCLHDTGTTFAPARVHSGSISAISGLYICLHDTTTNVMLAPVTLVSLVAVFWMSRNVSFGGASPQREFTPLRFFPLKYKEEVYLQKKYVARARRGMQFPFLTSGHLLETLCTPVLTNKAREVFCVTGCTQN